MAVRAAHCLRSVGRREDAADRACVRESAAAEEIAAGLFAHLDQEKPYCGPTQCAVCSRGKRALILLVAMLVDLMHVGGGWHYHSQGRQRARPGP